MRGGLSLLDTIVPNTQQFPAGGKFDAKSPWSNLYPGTRFMMNANFFEVGETVEEPNEQPEYENLNPYLASVRCTKAVGYSVADGELVSGGSGSAQMYFSNSTGSRYSTLGSDTAKGVQHLYRPVPVFLGIK